MLKQQFPEQVLLNVSFFEKVLEDRLNYQNMKEPGSLRAPQ